MSRVTPAETGPSASSASVRLEECLRERTGRSDRGRPTRDLTEHPGHGIELFELPCVHDTDLGGAANPPHSRDLIQREREAPARHRRAGPEPDLGRIGSAGARARKDDHRVLGDHAFVDHVVVPRPQAPHRRPAAAFDRTRECRLATGELLAPTRASLRSGFECTELTSSLREQTEHALGGRERRSPAGKGTERTKVGVLEAHGDLDRDAPGFDRRRTQPFQARAPLCGQDQGTRLSRYASDEPGALEPTHRVHRAVRAAEPGRDGKLSERRCVTDIVEPLGEDGEDAEISIGNAVHGAEATSSIDRGAAAGAQCGQSARPDGCVVSVRRRSAAP